MPSFVVADPKKLRCLRNKRYQQRRRRLQRERSKTKRIPRPKLQRAFSDSALPLLRHSRRLRQAKEAAIGIPNRWAFQDLSMFAKTISALACPQCRGTVSCKRWEAANGGFRVWVCCTSGYCGWEIEHHSTPPMRGSLYPPWHNH